MDEHILSCLPHHLQHVLHKFGTQHRQCLVEEIRIRIQRPIEIITHEGSFFLTEKGTLTRSMEQGMMAEVSDGQKMLNLLSRHSVYAIEEELRRGYITLKGGHRVGIAGKAVVEQGNVKFLKDIQSYNIRVARQVKGMAQQVLPNLLDEGKLLNTLLISPPQCGKTTLLRDIVRCLSYASLAPDVRTSNENAFIKAHKVGVVDERSEIASCLDGIPQNDLGPRVDVLDGCPKAEGMMMLIRSMSPQVIACDEIGSGADAQAILEAMHAGVSVLTTAHGFRIEDMKQRPSLQELFTYQVFDRFVILSNRKGVGTVEGVYNGYGQRLTADRDRQPSGTYQKPSGAHGKSSGANLRQSGVNQNPSGGMTSGGVKHA